MGEDGGKVGARLFGQFRAFGESDPRFQRTARFERLDRLDLELGPEDPSLVAALLFLGRRRAALVAELSGPTEPDVFRSPFLLVAMNAELLSREQIATAIDARIGQLQRELKHMEEIAEAFGPGGARWIADYGRNCMAASLDYLTTHRAELESVTADDAPPAGQRAAG